MRTGGWASHAAFAASQVGWSENGLAGTAKGPGSVVPKILASSPGASACTKAEIEGTFRPT